MNELYVFMNKKGSKFFWGYLTGLKEISKYKRVKELDLDFKVEISETNNSSIRFDCIKGIHSNIKSRYKGNDKTLDEKLEKVFPSKAIIRCSNKDYFDLFIIKSKNKKFLAKLESYLIQKNHYCTYSLLINL